jgi:hypothetical protein
MIPRCAVIKKCRKEDKEPGKPWCLYTHDGKRLLGRHPTKEDAYKQESAIKAQSYLRLAVLELSKDN